MGKSNRFGLSYAMLILNNAYDRLKTIKGHSADHPAMINMAEMSRALPTLSVVLTALHAEKLGTKIKAPHMVVVVDDDKIEVKIYVGLSIEQIEQQPGLGEFTKLHLEVNPASNSHDTKVAYWEWIAPVWLEPFSPEVGYTAGNGVLLAKISNEAVKACQ